MNEEQAVLDFFRKPENLPLGLSVAALMDDIRIRLNSAFWNALQRHLHARQNAHAPRWQIQATEDRNAAGMLIGLQFGLPVAQEHSLFPMLEQQYLGGNWRIYIGLMWQSAPTPEQLALPEVASLKEALTDAGFSSNASFLGWQWTRWYPRSGEFLLRCSDRQEKLLDEVESVMSPLLAEHSALIDAANQALKGVPRNQTISLDRLHRR